MPDDDVKFLEAARANYASDEIEIDDNAVISRSDEGAFVAAWVWVSSADAGIETEEEL